MFYLVVVLVVAVVGAIAVGAVIAWTAGDRLQRAKTPTAVKLPPAKRFAQIDRLFKEVREKIDRDVEDPELVASLAKHLDDLQAKKDAAVDRLEDLETLLASPMPQAVRDTKLEEQTTLQESVEKIAAGLSEIKDRLTSAPNSGEVSKGVSDALSALKGELDSQDRARREIAELEKTGR